MKMFPFLWVHSFKSAFIFGNQAVPLVSYCNGSSISFIDSTKIISAINAPSSLPIIVVTLLPNIFFLAKVLSLVHLVLSF